MANGQIYLTVLNYQDGNVVQYQDDTFMDFQFNDFEVFLQEQGYLLSQVEWMTHSEGGIDIR
jgi:hypothetical protein